MFKLCIDDYCDDEDDMIILLFNLMYWMKCDVVDDLWWNLIFDIISCICDDILYFLIIFVIWMIILWYVE